MRTSNVNVVRGHSYENFQHKSLSYENFQIYCTVGHIIFGKGR